MLVTCVKFVDLCSQVMKMARAEARRTFLATLDGQPPDKQTRKTYTWTWRHAAKWLSFLSSRVSWRTLQTVGEHTLLHGWSLTALSCRCTASSSDTLAVVWIRKIAHVRITINKHILITTNKCIHIISTYFLAAANNKRVRLLTSLYGNKISKCTQKCENHTM